MPATRKRDHTSGFGMMAPDTGEGGPFWTSLSRASCWKSVLEEPPCPNVTAYVVDAGNGHLVADLGVNGSSVAHGYTDVGDLSAAVLAPEEQVSRLGSTLDRGPVAHLPTR